MIKAVRKLTFSAQSQPMFIISPEKFAKWFNLKYPGAYRQVVTDDVNEMTGC